VLTAPKTYAGDIKAFAKAVPSGKTFIYALQMHRNIVSLNKRFGRQCFKTAQVLAAKRYTQAVDENRKLNVDTKV
jgi:hypothetical protein